MEQNTPYYMVRTLLFRLLQINVCKNVHDKEEALLQRITAPELREKLPLLNNLLNLKVIFFFLLHVAGMFSFCTFIATKLNLTKIYPTKI